MAVSSLMRDTKWIHLPNLRAMLSWGTVYGLDIISDTLRTFASHVAELNSFTRSFVAFVRVLYRAVSICAR